MTIEIKCINKSDRYDPHERTAEHVEKLVFRLMVMPGEHALDPGDLDVRIVRLHLPPTDKVSAFRPNRLRPG